MACPHWPEAAPARARRMAGVTHRMDGEVFTGISFGGLGHGRPRGPHGPPGANTGSGAEPLGREPLSLLSAGLSYPDVDARRTRVTLRSSGVGEGPRDARENPPQWGSGSRNAGQTLLDLDADLPHRRAR